MGESTGEESELGKETKLRRHLQRVKRLQRLHGRMQKRLEQEIRALEEFIRKRLQSRSWNTWTESRRSLRDRLEVANEWFTKY